jgi:Family of unknown function (DUF6502)
MLQCVMSAMKMNKTSEEKEAVLGIFAALVRPLMRLAFEYGITAGEISGVIRRVYIKALEDRLTEQQRPTSDARLAAVAGLTRSDVAALREAQRAGAALSNRAYASLDQIGSVLNVWSTHPNFSGAYGLTLDLDVQTVEGSARRSFPELTAIACPTVDADTLLMQLIAAGSIEIVDGQTVRCVSRAYVPKGSDVTRIERTGRFLGVAAGNFVHNLLRGEADPVYFERLVVSDEVLSDSSRDSFLKVTADRAQELLFELDTFLTHLPPTAANAAGKKYGVGIYFFEEPSVNGPIARSVNADSNGGEKRSVISEEIDVLAPKRRTE